jgi:hypothetical protein
MQNRWGKIRNPAQIVTLTLPRIFVLIGAVRSENCHSFGHICAPSPIYAVSFCDNAKHKSVFRILRVAVVLHPRKIRGVVAWAGTPKPHASHATIFSIFQVHAKFPKKKKISQIIENTPNIANIILFL